MTIYGIARKVSEGMGHGDPGGSCLGIIRLGSYMSGEYPPLFTTRKAAEEYVAALDYSYGIQIIELELQCAAREILYV